MKRNGTYALNFHAPALVGRQLTYLHGQQFAGRYVALCFLPYAGVLSAEIIDGHSEQFDRVDATLLIVGSGPGPLHRLWTDQSEKPWTPVLVDPCGRLHRSFGVAVTEFPGRCHTFVIDRVGILRLRVSHDFVNGDMEALRKIVGLTQPRTIDPSGIGKVIASVKSECLQS